MGSVEVQQSGNHHGLPGYEINIKEEEKPLCGVDVASQLLKPQFGHA